MYLGGTHAQALTYNSDVSKWLSPLPRITGSSCFMYCQVCRSFPGPPYCGTCRWWAPCGLRPSAARSRAARARRTCLAEWWRSISPALVEKLLGHFVWFAQLKRSALCIPIVCYNLLINFNLLTPSTLPSPKCKEFDQQDKEGLFLVKNDVSWRNFKGLKPWKKRIWRNPFQPGHHQIRKWSQQGHLK